MTETPTPAALDVQQGKPSLWSRLSFIWIVPFLALAITLGVAYQSYADRGTLITIIFEKANGIKPSETVIKFRDVDVGIVENVRFDEGLNDVIVEARIEKEIAPYLDQDAFFWVVSPDVSLRGVTGLDTVLSGVYIEGAWNDEADNTQTEFRGLEEPPLGGADPKGTSIILRAANADALSEGAPLLHKGIRVGYLEKPQLAYDGESVTVGAFVEFPYDQRITTSTRFWDTSGFSVNVGANGLSLDVDSLATLIEGGIAYDTVVSGGDPIRDGTLFDIFPDELTASESLFNDPDQPTAEIAVRFDDNVSGLRRGSEVRFQGIRVGQVRDIAAIVVEETPFTQVELQAVLAIEPGRLGLGENATPEDAINFLSNFVSDGLRARLVTGNILSGALTVELLRVDTALPAFMDPTGDPYPIVPTTTNVITDVADTAEGVLNRINDLPIEELLESAINLMDSVESLTSDPNIRDVPVSTVALLDEARALVGSDDLQSLPNEARDVIAGVQSAVNDIIAAQIGARLVETLDNANAAADNVIAGTENLPAIAAELETLLAKANALELEALIDETTATLGVVSGYIADENTAALPGALVASLDETTALIAEARALVASDDVAAIPGELRTTIAGLNAIIAEATEERIVAQLAAAVDSAAASAASVQDAASGLPGIVRELENLAQQANELEVDALVTEATRVLNTIDTLFSSDATQDLPASLSASLDELRLFLAEVREGGAINNVNAALASANEAAQAIEQAAASLPALAAQAQNLMARTDNVVQTYGDRSRFNAETLSALRDIQEAADAVSALARAIQRNPNSLLTGR